MSRILQLLLALTFVTGSVAGQKTFTQTGDASYYSDELTGRYTASGEKYDTLAYTAAHMTLPFGTHARVTNMKNGRSVVVKINDRGPFVSGRVIDLSKAAAREIGLLQEGITRVKIEVVNRSEAIGPRILPKEEEEKNTIKSPVVTPAIKPQPAQANQNTPALISGLIKVNAVTSEDKGYGVQIGSYTQIQNVFEIVASLNHPCYIQVTQKEGEEPLYRVIAGDFPDRKQAESLRNSLTGTYSGCFVVNVESLLK
ncbi:MAG: septal ring lytic transglycosylase RlpA family protein [Bacteroidota bacterium]